MTWRVLQPSIRRETFEGGLGRDSRSGTFRAFRQILQTLPGLRRVHEFQNSHGLENAGSDRLVALATGQEFLHSAALFGRRLATKGLVEMKSRNLEVFAQCSSSASAVSADWNWVRQTGQSIGEFLGVPVMDKLYHGG